MNKITITIVAIALVAIVATGIFLILHQENKIIPTPVINTTTTSFNKTLTPITANNIADANNQFAFEIYSLYSSGNQNVFISPFSISSALAMTYEGAKGQTADEIKSVFHFPDNMKDPYKSLYDEINKKDKPYNLSTANALWAQKDYTFSNEYLSTVETYYGGKATNLDFRTETEKSRITINDWVESQTNNKIKNLIPEGTITPMTRLVLTNAIYFYGNWTNPFEKEATRDEDFNLSSGNTIKAQMMHQQEIFNYAETDTLQILELPYRGDELSMLVLLPKDNDINSLDKSLSAKTLSSLKNNMSETLVQLHLPKFKFEAKYMLASALKTMGMPTAFSDNADFSGMTGDKNKTLFISEVIHQAFVAVDEQGTEAAAATAVMMAGASAPGERIEPIVFNADHPFIFLIQEKKTGNILFLGKVLNPSAA